VVGASLLVAARAGRRGRGRGREQHVIAIIVGIVVRGMLLGSLAIALAARCIVSLFCSWQCYLVTDLGKGLHEPFVLGAELLVLRHEMHGILGSLGLLLAKGRLVDGAPHRFRASD